MPAAHALLYPVPTIVYVILGGNELILMLLTTPLVVARPVAGDHDQLLHVQSPVVAYTRSAGNVVIPGYKQVLNVSYVAFGATAGVMITLFISNVGSGNALSIPFAAPLKV